MPDAVVHRKARALPDRIPGLCDCFLRSTAVRVPPLLRQHDQATAGGRRVELAVHANDPRFGECGATAEMDDGAVTARQR